MGSEDVPDYAILVSTFYGIDHGKEASYPVPPSQYCMKTSASRVE
ncbi:MAG: hypothetical protein QXQ10_08205 [Nitrososphaerota archaeon]